MQCRLSLGLCNFVIFSQFIVFCLPKVTYLPITESDSEDDDDADDKKKQKEGVKEEAYQPTPDLSDEILFQFKVQLRHCAY